VAAGKPWVPWLAAAVVVVACGGGNEAAPPATPPAQSTAASQPAAAAAAPAEVAQDTAAQDSAAAALALSREVFAFRGSGRDPFQPLTKSGDLRPDPKDLRVVGITFDPRYPQRSVAVLNDRSDARRYTVRPGDVVGRIRIVEVRATEVIAVVQEFGVDRQLVLPLRRRQEEAK
jgi:hypothetical protein